MSWWGGGGDQGHPRCGAPGPGDPGVDLSAGQVTALAGLCPLGHLDLDLLGADQIRAGDAEPAGGHLLDGGAPLVAQTLRLLAALAGVGLAADPIHGDRQTLVGLLGDGAVAHGAGLEPADDALLGLHLLDGDAAALIEFEVQQTPEGVGLGGLVHQGGVVLEHVVAVLPDGLLQQQDTVERCVWSSLSGAGAELVDAGGVQGGVVAQAQGVEGLAVVPLHALADLVQADAAHPADGVGEIPVHHLPVDAHALEDLGGLVGLDGGDAHLGGDLHDAVEDGTVVVVDSGGGILVQKTKGHQLLHALLGEIRVDGLGAVAQERREVVDVPGLRALQDHGHGGALFRPNQILLQGGDRQQGGDGNMVLVHTAVRQDQDVGAVFIGPVRLHEQPVQGVCQWGALVVQQRDGLRTEAGPVHVADLHQVHRGEDGVVDLEDRAVLRPLLQQVAGGAHVDRGVGNDLLPDGVHGRVGHLGEELLEVAEQGLVLLREHRQRRVRPHGGGGLRPVPGHGENGVLHLLIGIAEGLVQPVTQLLRGPLHPPVGDGEVPEMDQVGIQPLAVGLPAGVMGLDRIVVHQTAGGQVCQQHLPGLEPGLLHDLLRRDVQHPHLGGEDQRLIVGEIPPAGPQAVPVQYRAYRVAVGEHDGRRAVPGLHHGGVVVVEVPLLPAHPPVVGPGLGDAHHHRLGQGDAVHQQEFQGIVQHGGVRPALVDHREELVHVRLQDRGAHGLLPGQHPVRVAPDGVDLPVVEDCSGWGGPAASWGSCWWRSGSGPGPGRSRSPDR